MKVICSQQYFQDALFNLLYRGGGGWGWRMKSKCVTNQLEITAQFFHLVMFIMRHKMALTLQSVNTIQVRVTIQVKATKYSFQVGPFIMYFKAVVLLGKP